MRPTGPIVAIKRQPIRSLHWNEYRGVVTGWTGVDTSTPLFPEGFCEIESLWSVLISFRLYPQTLPPTWEGTPLPHLTHTVHPTLFNLATPLCANRK